MLAILARRKREASLDPTERTAATAETVDGEQEAPRLPPGSRSRRSTRLEVPVLLDLLSARTHATEPYHIDALAKEFGLDSHTLLSLGRRFGAPREVEQIVESAPNNSDVSGLASRSADPQPPSNRTQAETQTQTQGQGQVQRGKPDLPSTSIGGESTGTQRFLVWADVPEVKVPLP